jgi:hypothetical protein
MIIITKFDINITKYAKLGKENTFPSICGCKYCGYEKRLHRHGFYERNAITLYEVLRNSDTAVRSWGTPYVLISNLMIG